MEAVRPASSLRLYPLDSQSDALVLDDTRPPSGRRPRSSRYLKNVAAKLADDSARESRFESMRSPTAESMRSPTPTWTQNVRSLSSPTKSDSAETVCAASEADLWRRVFHVEAHDCVKQLQDVFGGASTTHFASRFEEWRRVDLKATAQMQHHVKQLTRLNEAVEEFLSKCATPDAFTNFEGSVAAVARCVADLSTARNEMTSNVDAIAERAADKVLSAWRSEVRGASELLRLHTDEQRERWGLEAKREADIDARLEELRLGLSELRAESRHLNGQVGELATTQHDASESLSTAWRGAVDEIEATTRTEMQQLTEALRQSATTDMLAFEKHVQDVLVGKAPVDKGDRGEKGDDASLCLPSVGQTLGSIDRRLYEWVAGSLKDVAQWKQTSADLKTALEEARSETGKWRASTDDTRATLAKLDAQAQDSRRELSAAQHALETALASSLSSSLHRLKEIESRGCVKLNRQTGVLRLVQAVDFVPGKETEHATFVDLELANRVLRDVAEVVGLFDAPVGVEVHARVPRGGALAVVSQQVCDWAALVQMQLVSAGVPSERISAKGVAPSQASETVIVQIDPTLFATGKAGKAGSSPARR